MKSTATQPTGNTKKTSVAQKTNKATCVLNNIGMQRYIANHVTAKAKMVINIMFHKPGTGWQ